MNFLLGLADATARMCGLLVLAGSGSRPPSVSDAVAEAMRDRMSHRGPDGAGLFRDGPVLLAHRRLAISRPHDNPQPLVVGGSDDPERVTLVFNGELFAPEDLRSDLVAAGHAPRSGTDTELFALAIAAWGEEAFARVRGMYAVAAWRPGRRDLLLARDALGVVPLYHALVDGPTGPEFVAASEPPAILAHPAMPIRPNWSAVANYLVSLRTECAGQTLFEGVHSLPPGCLLRCSLGGERPELETRRWWRPVRRRLDLDEHEAARLVRTTVADSVRRHLAADVPVAALLSGGLDSAIVVACALEAGVRLPTFCAGAPEIAGSDLEVGRRTADGFGLPFRTAHVDGGDFVSRWRGIVEKSGLPLSTPNEVAIQALAERIRPFASVALSGEGADELFAGYGPALAVSESWIAEGSGPVQEWYVEAFSWVSPRLLPSVFAPEVATLADPTAALDEVRAAFADGDPRSLRTHLDVQRSLNLPSLLRRLNMNLMASSVEGRTPFADCAVAELAGRLPMESHLADREDEAPSAVALATLPRTKRLLRRAFADLLPTECLVRPKASFPLPFETWLAPLSGVAEESCAARNVLSADARALLRRGAPDDWRLVWPLLNLALWLRRWWG